MLVSKFVSEIRSDKRRVARACNIAKWITENYSKYAGLFISVEQLRSSISSDHKDTTLDPLGDRRAHGDALYELGVSRKTVDGVTYVDISLPNLKRCASFLLGQGRRVGALSLVRDFKAVEIDARQDLSIIDNVSGVCGVRTVNFKKLSENAQKFVVHLNNGIRQKIERGEKLLTEPQRKWALDLIKKHV